jgi:hypothetical protein
MIIKSRRLVSESKQGNGAPSDSTLGLNNLSPQDAFNQYQEDGHLLPAAGPNHSAASPYGEAFQRYWEQALHHFDRKMQKEALQEDIGSFGTEHSS